MQQKVLILGSRGQLGRTLRDEISHCFLVRGIFCPSRKQLDITDKEALLAYVKRFQIDTIINCAAYTNVKGAETDYEGAYAVNVKAIENLCATNCKIIHISTDYVFDGEKGDFYTEEDETNPLNVYGKTKRDGEEILMVKIKGAPVTFDLDLLKERIINVSQGKNVGWPVYNRLTHNPSENALTVSGDIIILEGNYLLLEEEGWKDLRQYADYTVRISADENDLRNRLIDRKVKSGTAYKDAVAFVEHSDLYNARTCLQRSMKADLNLKLNHDDSYSIENDNHRFSSEPDIPDCGCIYG